MIKTTAMRDYYEILNLDRNASDEAIKKAYRKMAMKYHPDRNPGDKSAEENFKEAAEAYDVLRDPQKRQRYDRFGHDGLKGGGFGGFDIDLGEALRTFMSEGFGFGDIFGNSRSRGRERQRRGGDLQVRLNLTLEEVAEGVRKKIKLQKAVVCETCAGKGAINADAFVTCLQCQGKGEIRQVSQSLLGQFINVTTCPRCSGQGRVLNDPCEPCRGEGRVQGQAVISLDVPAGVTSGNYITVRGEGHAGPNNGPAGDVIVLIDELEHEDFQRHGDDILYNLPVSFSQVALGAEVEVPTLNGKARLTIQPGTQPNKILRMRGKGIKHLNEGGKGDQLIRIIVWTPTTLGSKERMLFEELANSDHSQPPVDDPGFFRRMKEAIF